MTDLAGVIKIYEGSNGDATRALYAELEQLGPIGVIGLNLFRACKCSERAKEYRGRGYKGAAYDRKQWSMDNLCTALEGNAASLDIVWGWGVDEKQDYHRHVLYVELATGQVSFHSATRGKGPDYPSGWDGRPGQSAGRICQWVARILVVPVPA